VGGHHASKSAKICKKRGVKKEGRLKREERGIELFFHSLGGEGWEKNRLSLKRHFLFRQEGRGEEEKFSNKKRGEGGSRISAGGGYYN